MTANVTLELPMLRPDQLEIARHPAKIKFITCGRRYGKTTLGQVLVLSAASAGLQVAWVVPTYQNARPLWRVVERSCRSIEKHGLCRISRQERVVEFKNGGFLGVYSADNEASVLGNAFHLVIIDEAARVPDNVYYDSIIPTLADYDGDIFCISTPKGMGGFFYHEFMKGMYGKDPRQASWQASSLLNPMPTIQAAYYRAQSTMPRRTFEQEWNARFVSDDGAVFSNVYGTCIAKPEFEPVPGEEYVAGLDWGKQIDYTVLSVFSVDRRKMVYMLRTNDDYPEQRAKIRQVYDRYKLSYIIAESNSIGLPNITELQNQGMDVYTFHTGSRTKEEIIENLSLMMEKGPNDPNGIVLLDDQVIVSELVAYSYEKTATGRTRYSAPKGGHDDCVMSIAMGAKALETASVSSFDWDSSW